MGLKDNISNFIVNRLINNRMDIITNAINNRMKDISSGNGRKKFTDSNGANVTGKIREWFKIVKRKLGFDRYYSNPYDFKTLRTAYENEVFVRRAVDHYMESVMRNGYDVVGENEDDVLYIERRFSEMEMVSGVSVADVCRESVCQLLLYGNLIPHLVRNEKASSGTRYRRFDGKEVLPIAAIFVEDARSIKIRNDEKQGLVYERHYDKDYYIPSGSGIASVYANYAITNFPHISKKSTLKAEDVIHLGFHRAPGDVWAAPPFTSVIDDIRTLRLIEENVELIVFQYGHPILHGKVGDKESTGTKSEVDDLNAKIEAMESNGFIITNNRVELDFINGGESVELSKYLEYFKNRVFTGLYMSDISMGESDTGTRSTADYLSKDSVNRTTELQMYIQDMFRKIIKQLLLERGYNYKEVNRNEHSVELVFPEVDIEAKVKVEEHYTNMFVQNAITIDEARAKMGFKPITDEEMKRTFSQLVTMAQVEKEAELYKQQTAGAMLGRNLTSGIRSQTAQKSNNKTKQTLTPRNQYGKKTAPSVSKK